MAQLSSNSAKIELLARYGTLAPSTHNTQPWKCKIKGDTLQIFIDFSKKIPVADPLCRDMYISLGALIKNVELAASAFGVEARTRSLAKDFDDDLVAEISFPNLDRAKDPASSPLLEGILRRQNYRGFFTEKFDEKAFTQVLGAAVKPRSGVSVAAAGEKDVIEALAQLTVKGLRMAYATEEFRKEISSYINHNLSRKRRGLHGYSLRLNTPQSFVIPKIMKRKDIGAKLGALNYKSFIRSSAVLVLTTQKDTPRDWLEVGKTMEEIMVRASIAGLATSIYTAAIEMPGLRQEVAKTLKLQKSALPQILFCVGTPGEPLSYSVRHNIHKVLQKA